MLTCDGELFCFNRFTGSKMQITLPYEAAIQKKKVSMWSLKCFLLTFNKTDNFSVKLAIDRKI